MRQHGINMRDPTFSGNNGIPTPQPSRQCGSATSALPGWRRYSPRSPRTSIAPKVAAMDTWRPHATVRIDLAEPGRPIRSLVAEDRSAGGVRDQTGTGKPDRNAWSTFGPHAIGTERFATVSSGASLRRSPMRSWGNRLGRRTLIRMRSQVQVLAGPPPAFTSGNDDRRVHSWLGGACGGSRPLTWLPALVVGR
jgi:hypothetical protein